MRTRQGALTVIAEVEPSRLDALRAVLDEIEADIESNPVVPFDRLSTVHFARWVILPEAVDVSGSTVFPTQLVFSTNYDPPVEAHFDELVEVAFAGLDRVYRCCKGYGAGGESTPERLIDFLRAHTVDNQIFYIGTPGISVERVRQEAQLREAIEAFLDRQPGHHDGWAGQTPAAIRDAIQDFVRSRPELAWACEAPPPRIRPLHWTAWIGLGFAALITSPLIALWMVLLRIQEILDARQLADHGVVEADADADTEPDSGAEAEPDAEASPEDVGESLASQYARPSDQKLRRVTRIEDHIVQNQLSHVVEIKPGLIRAITLHVVLAVMDFGGRRIYNQGQLFGVRTLHFVRWLRIDGGRRLLFLTNYDGSMISYVGDFVHKSWQIPSALTAIWSQTFGFPASRWLILGGARDIRRFTDFLRRHQVPSQAWYSAYKRLTTGNIINNAGLRRGLFADLDDAALAAWMRRL